MNTVTITSTDFQNNVGKYMDIAEDNGEVVIKRKGSQKLFKLVAVDERDERLSSLVGILKDTSETDAKDLRHERIVKKHGRFPRH